jgi:hypothetical protein
MFRGIMHSVIDVSKRLDTLMKNRSLNIISFDPASVQRLPTGWTTEGSELFYVSTSGTRPRVAVALSGD